MARASYRTQAIVLRKTRLREADLIVTLLAQDGTQIRAVAKGALKPAGTFASRLELYSCVDVLLARGKSLDIVTEARIVDAHGPLRFDYERSICAAPMAELLSVATQAELPVPRLFEMTQVGLSHIEKAKPEAVPLVMCAFLLKAVSFLGFRPGLGFCAECGQSREPGEEWSFSFETGGVICPDCVGGMKTDPVPAALVDWAAALIGAPFADVDVMEADEQTARMLVLFCRDWIQTHVGRLKSIAFVLSDDFSWCQTSL